MIEKQMQCSAGPPSHKIQLAGVLERLTVISGEVYTPTKYPTSYYRVITSQQSKVLLIIQHCLRDGKAAQLLALMRYLGIEAFNLNSSYLFTLSIRTVIERFPYGCFAGYGFEPTVDMRNFVMIWLCGMEDYWAESVISGSTISQWVLRDKQLGDLFPRVIDAVGLKGFNMEWNASFFRHKHEDANMQLLKKLAIEPYYGNTPGKEYLFLYRWHPTADLEAAAIKRPTWSYQNHRQHDSFFKAQIFTMLLMVKRAAIGISRNVLQHMMPFIFKAHLDYLEDRARSIWVANNYIISIDPRQININYADKTELIYVNDKHHTVALLMARAIIVDDYVIPKADRCKFVFSLANFKLPSIIVSDDLKQLFTAKLFQVNSGREAPINSALLLSTTVIKEMKAIGGSIAAWFAKDCPHKLDLHQLFASKGVCHAL